jgi:hypothetical protein
MCVFLNVYCGALNLQMVKPANHGIPCPLRKRKDAVIRGLECCRDVAFAGVRLAEQFVQAFGMGQRERCSVEVVDDFVEQLALGDQAAVGFGGLIDVAVGECAARILQHILGSLPGVARGARVFARLRSRRRRRIDDYEVIVVV